MKRRLVLSAIWMCALLLAVLITEAYFARTVIVMDQQVHILTSTSRVAAYQALAQIYGPMILLMGSAWFAKVFKDVTDSAVEVMRFRLAMASTLLYNAIMLGMLAAPHFGSPEGMVLSAFDDARKVGLALAFLLAWPNVHYFGAKPPGESAVGA